MKTNISAEGNSATLKVNNEGPPIPDNVRDLIFTGMYTNNGENHVRQNSYELGLYIVKEIVDGHNGKIDLESNAAVVTTFTVVLPRH